MFGYPVGQAYRSACLLIEVVIALRHRDEILELHDQILSGAHGFDFFMNDNACSHNTHLTDNFWKMSTLKPSG
ncbi:hypothetical protein TNCV_3861791 [Trichonephila clavipes]|nr:hypothetical protein TNCV_3861791 [Trichonephila clavipes]